MKCNIKDEVGFLNETSFLNGIKFLGVACGQAIHCNLFVLLRATKRISATIPNAGDLLMFLYLKPTGLPPFNFKSNAGAVSKENMVSKTRL